jgi:hypothetical protein
VVQLPFLFHAEAFAWKLDEAAFSNIIIENGSTKYVVKFRARWKTAFRVPYSLMERAIRNVVWDFLLLKVQANGCLTSAFLCNLVRGLCCRLSIKGMDGSIHAMISYKRAS